MYGPLRSSRPRVCSVLRHPVSTRPYSRGKHPSWGLGRIVSEFGVALTKLDLSESVLEALNTTRRESGQIVEIVLASMVRALRAGDKVEIRGFGTFHTRA